MAKIDFHSGRFTADFETTRLRDGMRGWKQGYGTFLDYYRLNADDTTHDDIYGEVTGNGRQYFPVTRLGCLHVQLIPGANTWDDKGFYYNDDLRALVPYDVYEGSGMPLADLNTGKYEMDRIIYKQKVFRVVEIDIQGQIQDLPNIVVIDATQLKPDELYEDPQFAAYATGGLAP